MKTDKYFNELIKRIENPLGFNIFRTLSPLIENLQTDEKIELEQQLSIIGISRGFFNRDSDGTGWYSLTKLGVQLKDSGKDFRKFEKSQIETKWYNENWIGYAVAFMALLFVVFQSYHNRSLNRKYENLKTQYEIHKDSMLQLKQEFEISKQKQIINTSKTNDSVD